MGLLERMEQQRLGNKKMPWKKEKRKFFMLTSIRI